MRRLTTTSYAILGLLAIRPSSAYELTAEMRRSAIRDFWPRTESRLYDEPKSLAEHGLIAARKEHRGRRPRTVYRITPKGRRSLRRWLGERASPQKIEDETMLKVALAESGTRVQLLATLRAEFETLHARAGTLAEIGQDLSRGRVRFPQRLHVAAALGRFALATLRTRIEYLEWLEGWVESWDDTEFDPSRADEVEAMLEETAREISDTEAYLRSKLERLDADEGVSRE